MAVTITNQASLSFTANGAPGTAVSNLATATLQGPIEVNKSIMETSYTANSVLTYLVSVNNTSSATLTNVTVEDNLGTYSYQPNPDVTAINVTPLVYMGPTRYFVNGVDSGTLIPNIDTNSMTYTIPTLAPNSTALLIYDVTVGDTAPLAANSTVTNTVNVTATDVETPIEDTAEVSVEENANINIIKSMSPNPAVEGSPITYTFTVYNYGNTSAENVVLTDVFSPAPGAPLAITVNGDAVTVGYTYENNTLTLPTGTGTAITVPAATFTQGTNGVVSTTPGVTTITVTGTI